MQQRKKVTSHPVILKADGTGNGRAGLGKNNRQYEKRAGASEFKKEANTKVLKTCILSFQRWLQGEGGLNS